VLLAVPLTKLALKFGPPEFFALMLVGLSLVSSLAGRSILLALVSAVIGLLIAMVGIDPWPARRASPSAGWSSCRASTS
jgi:putative tricarboxylic transport membrane protein